MKIRTILLALVVAAAAIEPPAAKAGQAFMNIGGETSQPIGHYAFCGIRPDECAIRSGATGGAVLTEAMWGQLLHVNSLVNQAIAPVSDFDLFGEPEVWYYPATQGDCEDYVLLKRKLLADAGWSLSDLLITVVLKPDGEGHAVLTVRTDRGDFILDNLVAEVRLWSETPYQYVKRQSTTDTGRWVAIRDGREVEVAVVGR